MTHHCEWPHSSTLLIHTWTIAITILRAACVGWIHALSTLSTQNNFCWALLQTLSNGSPKTTRRLVFLINLGPIGILTEVQVKSRGVHSIAIGWSQDPLCTWLILSDWNDFDSYQPLTHPISTKQQHWHSGINIRMARQRLACRRNRWGQKICRVARKCQS